MGDLAFAEEPIADRYERIRPWLNERQRRVWLGNEALALGYGGIKTVAQATGVHPDTVARGRAEVDSGDELDERVRRAGAGRKGAAERDPGLEEALFELVSPVTRGDPESVLVWTSASTVNLARALTEAGHPVSATGLVQPARGSSQVATPTAHVLVLASKRPAMLVDEREPPQIVEAVDLVGMHASGIERGPVIAEIPRSEVMVLACDTDGVLRRPPTATTCSPRCRA